MLPASFLLSFFLTRRLCGLFRPTFHKFDHGHGCRIAGPGSGWNNSGIAAVSGGKSRCYLSKKAAYYGFILNKTECLTPCVQVSPLRKSDHFFRQRTNLFRLCSRRFYFFIFEQ